MTYGFPRYIKTYWYIFAIAVFIVMTVLAGYILFLLNQEGFYKGIIIEDIDVSGLDRAEAKQLVELSLRMSLSKEIELIYDEQVWKINTDDILYIFKTDDIIEKAYNTGRTGGIVTRLKCIRGASRNKMKFYCEADFNRDELLAFLLKIKRETDREKKNAKITYINSEIIIEKEIVARDLNIDTNMELVENKIRERVFTGIELVAGLEIPDIVYEDICEIKYVMATFATTFNTADLNRTHNLDLACSRINGIILKSGEIFSMNRALGPRTIENGYKEAPVIFKNELIKGPGGGICQVTTTLYVAVLKARIEIIERSNHSMPLAYVNPGQDATIAEGAIDFKFQNSLTYDDVNYPLCISAEIKGDKVITRILGSRDNGGINVTLKSEILEVYLPEEDEILIDENVPLGEIIISQKSRKGLKVAVYREIKDESNGTVVREKISEDIYMPVRGQQMVNPADYYGMKGEDEDEDWEGTQ